MNGFNNRTVSLRSAALLIITSFIFVASCARKTSKDVVIGVVAPLTGPIAPYGENIRDGVLLAVDEINKKGGVNGSDIKIVFEDEGGGPQAAVNAVIKLATLNKVAAIIGPATSNGIMATAPFAEANHIVLLTPSGTSDNIREAGDYVFRNRASATQEASIFAYYIIEDLGINEIAILRADADYAVSFADVCKGVIAGNGGKILTEEVFAEGTTDFRTQLTKIKVASPEGFIIIGVPIELGNILKQSRELGIRTRMFSNTIDSPEILKIAEGAEEGLSFVTTFYDPVHGDERTRKFDTRFKDRFGRASHLFGANAYDAMYILTDVIRNYGNNGEAIKEGLYEFEGIHGAAGFTAFDEKGDLRSTRVAVKKILDGKFVFVKEVQR
ncbi:ABC transporter substrate-binding protein [Candidatus Neomarinimicrobiota bacterium]